jgi:hypothetical protein
MRRSSLFLRLLITVVVAQMFLFAKPAAAQIKLFQNYFGTMDYSVNGTGKLRGSGKRDQVTGEYLASKSIKVEFPRTSDLVGAFLYWQTHETSGLPSSARAYLSYPSNPRHREPILGKPIGNTGQVVACWNTGGGGGGSFKTKPFLRMYRADVLRYLEDPDTEAIPTEITAFFRDGGSTGNGQTLVEGGSLLLIYRHPLLKFKSIVIHDGTGTMDQVALTLPINGFDQASYGEAKASLGIGNGQANFSEQFIFNGGVVATNPFQNIWENPTFDVTSYMGNLTGTGNPPVRTFPPPESATPISSVTAQVAPYGKPDCLSVGFFVLSTTVQDTDEDGLLDFWETFGKQGLNLPGWGTNRLRKDLLVEIDYMFDSKAGSVHEHLPKLKTLQMVRDAFNNAPVANPYPGAPSADVRPNGINVIFDISAPLQNGENPYQGITYIIDTLNVGAAKGGGNRISERLPSLYCGETTQALARQCPLPGQPGVISWKKGFQRIKNTFFDDARLGIFHYVVFGHQLGILGPQIAPGLYAGASNSGRADLPGDSFAVTLGRWRSASGEPSAELAASVFLHELAHNLHGRHAGVTLDLSPEFQPLGKLTPLPISNCTNKLSSLNYKHTSAGLIDAAGVYRINLSGDVLESTIPLAQDESGLQEDDGLGPGQPLPYRLRWYAPKANVEARFKKKDGTVIPMVAASRHCDGTNKSPTEPAMVRVDGPDVARFPVDWDYDTIVEDLLASKQYVPSLDTNFNGRIDSTQDLAGFNDWESIVKLHGLQQVGSGRNLHSLSLGVHIEDLLRAEESDLSEDDLSEDDLSEDDLSEDDLSEDDLSEDDLSEDDLSEDDLSEDDLSESNEMDEDLANAIGGNGPTGLLATPVSNPQRRVLLTWSAPAFGGEVNKYFVYRRTGTEAFEEIGQPTQAGTEASPFVDDKDIRNGRTYIYVIIAEFNGTPTTTSAPSNIATATP